MSMGGYIGIGICVIVLLWIIVTYNRLVERRNRVRNSWSQVDIVLKNRFDLIPNLIETVSGYTGYERETLSQITEMRTKYASASSVADKASASGELSAALGRVMMVAEGYPDLKASANFLYLKEQLTEIEDKIRYARQFYNDAVEVFNTALAVFPSNLLAGMFGFREEAFFRMDEAEKALPKVPSKF
ncbi:LemA family protein [Paenibacillus oenotherae]|uniref:LemA family protein n=1 Tax=Paenibacillus oenotherae TaxID=1435645 RepID=A0ABS7D705_9BACL|nr:LemA family protein [Paenibacillus oenotherae]MBW7475715.1 LemA family protein [Paenibacillus oenotherae]